MLMYKDAGQKFEGYNDGFKITPNTNPKKFWLTPVIKSCGSDLVFPYCQRDCSMAVAGAIRDNMFTVELRHAMRM